LLNHLTAWHVHVLDRCIRWLVPGARTASSQHGEEAAVRGRGKIAMRPQFKILVIYNYNRPGAEASEAIIDNWWRQGMMGGAKAHYDEVVAFSQTDFTEDLKTISVPVLVMHSEDDQVVPYADSGPLTARLLKNGTLKTYHGFPHGMPTTQAETINRDLLAFLQS
jgi:non-heme chloroperoxidase